MATTKLMTAEDLWQLDDEPGRFDLIRGELIQMPPAGGRHGKLAMRIGQMVANFVDEHTLGDVYAAETGFIIRRDPDVVLAPDVAFVQLNRLPPEDQQEGHLELAPDLVVEVVSPSDRSRNVTNKVIEYLEASVRQVWVVEPSRNVVSVYTPDRKSVMLTVEDELDGGEVLPGFRLPVADIFK
jgi:Uma2 family endonuclease